MTEGRTTPGCDVWIVRLAGVPGADGLLDAEEVGRAARFRRPADRDRYVAAHAALRAVLARYAGRPPGGLAFAREPCPLCGAPHGRPRLAGALGAGPAAWHFSLAHGGAVAAVAVARRPVGVDVEAADRGVGADDLAAALHPDERRALAALPAADRGPAALRAWVRKEAVLKGLGTGLGRDPATVAVGVGPAPGPGPDGWAVRDVAAGDGLVAAVALAPADAAGAPDPRAGPGHVPTPAGRSAAAVGDGLAAPGKPAAPGEPAGAAVEIAVRRIDLAALLAGARRPAATQATPEWG
ncbi:MAG TPA: 4'-phosphopantetheinyl transferase superfamily protein [Acidimicrobiales bacterium]